MADRELLDHIIDIKQSQATVIQKLKDLKEGHDGLTTLVREHIRDDAEQFTSLQIEQALQKKTIERKSKMMVAFTAALPPISALVYWIIR